MPTTRELFTLCSTPPKMAITRNSSSTPLGEYAAKKNAMLRGLLEFKPAYLSQYQKLSLWKHYERFATGAMSFSSIGAEAHETQLPP